MMTATRSQSVTVYGQALQGSLNQISHVQQPVWLAQLQKSARNRFESLGFPTRRMEAWRYLDLGPVLNQQFELFPDTLPPISQETVASLFLSDPKALRLVFVNGQYVKSLSHTEGLPSGVVITDFQSAFAHHSQALEPYLARHIDVETDAFAALNTAIFQQGAVILVPEGVTLTQPVQVLFLTQGQGDKPFVAYPRLLVVARSKASAQVSVQFASLGTETSPMFSNSVAELYLEQEATLHYSVLRTSGTQSIQFLTSHAYLQEKSRLVSHVFAFEGRLSRHNLQVKLLGEGADCQLNGLSVLQGKSQVYDHTIISHLVPHCTSDQLYKGILDDQARSEFDGTIVIGRECPMSQASQLNQNLLLSDDARVLTRPQLVIDTDDVKCSHGATVGQLEAEHLFYLMSRGLSRQTAQHILTLGFAQEIVDRLTAPALKQQLHTLVSRQLSFQKEV